MVTGKTFISFIKEKKMKTFAFLIASLSLVTAAQAAAPSHERPDLAPVRQADAVETTQVPAGTVMSVRELSVAGLKASDLVTVTVVGHGPVAQNNRFSNRGDN
ncbi:hypothetical protein [Paracoccus sp. (in: a-proteobacteria)]|uniref:hypothetical protein n=1 Tax=Paracoccus sp. TaxID=267 RepID=UPI00396CF670